MFVVLCGQLHSHFLTSNHKKIAGNIAADYAATSLLVCYNCRSKRFCKYRTIK